MSTHNIIYRWTQDDKDNTPKPPPAQPPEDPKAKWDDFQRRKVTPYGFTPEMLPGCSANQPGARVTIDLTQSYKYPFEVMRFGHSPYPPKLPPDVEWADVPPEAADSATIGALCEKLLQLGNGDYKAKYGGLYDAFTKSDASTAVDRRELARAILEHWENTDCRYGLFSSGKANAKSAWDQPWDLPTKADVTESSGAVTYRIRRIPAHRPTQVTNPVAPGAQTARQADPVISMLDVDIVEIEMMISQIVKLLEQSRAALDERMRLVARLTGLEALVRVSAGATRGSDNDALPFVPRLRPLPEQVRKIMIDTPESTFLAAMEGPVESIKRQIGPVDALADDVERLSASLLEKLIGESFGKKSGAWGKAIVEKKLQQHPAVELRLGRLGQLAVAALEAVADGKSGESDAWAEKLWKILEGAGDLPPPVTPGQIKDTTFLEALLDLLHKRANQGTLITIASGSVGNLPGYPSITVAIAQTAAHWSLPKAALALKSGDSAAAKKLADRILGAFRRTLGTDATLIDQLEAAVQAVNTAASSAAAAATKAATSKLATDIEASAVAKAAANAKAAAADGLSKKITEKIGGNWQTSTKLKFGALAIQIWAFVTSVRAFNEETAKNPPTTTGDKIIWYLNVAGFGPAIGLVMTSGFDVALTGLGAMGKPAAATALANRLGYQTTDAASLGLGKAGYALGKIGAVISIVTGAVTVLNELSSKQWSYSKSDGYLLASGALGTTSGVLTLLASYVGAEGSMTVATFFTASASCPPLAALAAITAALSIAVLLIEEEQKAARQRFNVIVASDLKSLAASRYYRPLLRLNKDVAQVFTDLEAKLKEGTFPVPRGDIIVRVILRQAGFSAQDVDAVAGGASWGDIGALSTGGATP
jgi:hypothetical protein